MRDAVKSGLANQTASHKNLRQKLNDYLSVGPVSVENIVAWWGVPVKV